MCCQSTFKDQILPLNQTFEILVNFEILIFFWFSKKVFFYRKFRVKILKILQILRQTATVQLLLVSQMWCFLVDFEIFEELLWNFTKFYGFSKFVYKNFKKKIAKFLSMNLVFGYCQSTLKFCRSYIQFMRFTMSTRGAFHASNYDS